MNVQRFLVVSLLAISTACASAGTSSAPRTYSRLNGAITRTEIQESSQSDVFELVRSLRPNWLRTRGVSSLTRAVEIRVYMDGVSLGDAGTLRSIPSMTVQTVEFLDASSATQRFGTDHAYGAILVTTRR